MVFRLTLNPAASALLEDDSAEVRGIRIHMEKGAVYIKPSPSAIGFDVAPVAHRGRGGVEVFIEGSAENELLEILTAPKTPFFTLTLNEQGWLVLVPWKEKDAPRNRPLLRLWLPKSLDRTETRSIVSDYEELLRIANGYHRVGRPTREVAEAKAKLREFEEVAAMIAAR